MPDFTIKTLAEELKRTEEIHLSTVYDWTQGKNPLLSTYVGKDGRIMVKERVAVALLERWQSSRQPIEFSRAHGISERGGSLSHLVEKKIARTIYLFPTRKACCRILVSSDEAVCEYLRGAPQRQRENIERFRSLDTGHRWDGTETNVHRWNSREARAACKKGNQLRAARLKAARE